MGGLLSSVAEEETYENYRVVVPVDEEGFVQAFRADAGEGQEDGAEAAREFFARFGFVVFRDVLRQEECAAILGDLWQSVESGPRGVLRDQPATWDALPGGSVGILKADSRAAWETRQNPALHRCFAAILNEQDLLVSLDRFGLMRPTRQVLYPDGTRRDHPEWSTVQQWFHWDLNPWRYLGEGLRTEAEELDEFGDADGSGPGALLWDNPFRLEKLFVTENNERPKPHFAGTHKVQGVLALLDSTRDSGGFTCVPGFHRYLPHWVAKNKQTTRAPFVPVSHNTPEIPENAVKITMRAGSLCIWSSELPHCNYPNESDRFRACFYVKMFARRTQPTHLGGFLAARARALQWQLPKDFQVTELGQRVFGLDALPPATQPAGSS